MGVTLFRLDDDERVTSVFPVLDEARTSRRDAAEPPEDAPDV